MTVNYRERGTAHGCWQRVRPVPDANPGFCEGSSYEFQLHRGDWSMRIDDEPLTEDSDSASCVTWRPGFFAGEVTAELLRPDGVRAALFLLDVAPHPDKLGRDVFGEMIDGLAAAAPDLVLGTEPSTHRIGELGHFDNPWVEFARLRRHGPDFLRALAAIRAHPRRTLRARREEVAPHRVRHVDRQTAVRAIRSSAAALLVSDPDRAAAATHLLLDVPVVEQTTDSAANRALASLVAAAILRVRQLTARLQEIVETERESETRTPVAARWPARRAVLQGLAFDLAAVIRRPPLSDVSRREVTASGLTAIASDPFYSRAWTLGWRSLRRGADRSDTLERLWVSPTWEIYERWCFLRIGQLLAARFPQWNWQRHAEPHAWIGGCGSRRAELSLQPVFRSTADAEALGRCSISRQREPDLVLSVQSESGVEFVVLDAKYRQTRQNVLEAMESAHIYQDSLRIDGRRPDAALLLIPAGGGAPWLEKHEFHRVHRVGLHPFAPGQELTLPRLVADLIQS